MTDPLDAPDLHAAHPSDHHEYFLVHSKEVAIDHAQRSHRALWPAIESVIAAHARWAPPAIVEGWALLPDLVASLDEIAAVWIGVSAQVIETRVRERESLLNGATDPDGLVEALVERSVRFTHMLQTTTRSTGQPFVCLPPDATAGEAVDLVLQTMGLTTRSRPD